MGESVIKTLYGRFLFFLSTVLVIVTLGLFLTKVDLTPQIKPDFFFSSDSEIYKQDRAIQDKFPFQQQLLLNVTTDTITDPNYQEKIRTLSNRILGVQGINYVNSITHGPDDLEAARENPLWQRLLIGNGEKSSFIVAFVQTEDYTSMIKAVEDIVQEEQNQWFKIKISGLPYIVEQIKRNLTEDMKNFTLGAVGLSALVLLCVFRSFTVVGGALISCITAAMMTLVIQSFMGIPIGILTANLGTIVFVLTLSHIIFLVANWCNAYKKSPEAKLTETISHTFPASCWAALTTFLGFASLIYVEAKPLNQLGVGGSIGTACALLCAYTVFPAFLRLAKVSPSKFTYSLAKNFPLPKKIALGLTLIVLIGAGAVGFIGVPKINADPSLLTYFKEDSKLYDGIYHVDDNGGSNPLLFVIQKPNRTELTEGPVYNDMWDLQTALAEREEVGSVISLPVIMAEGDEHWLGQFLPWNMLLDILSKPEYGEVAKSFISPDRTQALFMLRMNEYGRDKDRLTIIEELKEIPPQYGFEIANVGGTYYLQGELAASVAKSMTTGIMSLIVLFGVIAFIVARRLLVSAGVMICALSISGIVLGTLGLLSIPVDIISSPAMNICLGLIVDDMIHLTVTARREAKEQGVQLRQWKAWEGALNTQSWPAIISTLTIMIGFSVFALSDFPPSQRFGLEIVYGAGLAVILALGVFPFIATLKKTSKK